MRTLRLCYQIAMDAFYRFNADDGWAIASHIALSALMSLFPFLILVTALAPLLRHRRARRRGRADPAGDLADPGGDAARQGDAERARHRARRRAHHRRRAGDLLRIERHREPAHRAEPRLRRRPRRRSWWLLRLESIGYVLVAAIALLALAFLVVLAPLIFATAVRYVPRLSRCGRCSTSCGSPPPRPCSIVALFIVHKWLPAGHRPLSPDRARHHRDAGAVARRRRTVRRLPVAASPTPTSPTTRASPR